MAPSSEFGSIDMGLGSVTEGTQRPKNIDLWTREEQELVAKLNAEDTLFQFHDIDRLLHSNRYKLFDTSGTMTNIYVPSFYKHLMTESYSPIRGSVDGRSVVYNLGNKIYGNIVDTEPLIQLLNV